MVSVPNVVGAEETSDVPNTSAVTKQVCTYAGRNFMLTRNRCTGD